MQAGVSGDSIGYSNAAAHDAAAPALGAAPRKTRRLSGWSASIHALPALARVPGCRIARPTASARAFDTMHRFLAAAVPDPAACEPENGPQTRACDRRQCGWLRTTRAFRQVRVCGQARQALWQRREYG